MSADEGRGRGGRERRTQMRPCIDLHDGQVKQIVGGTLTDSAASGPRTNFTSTLPATHYAELFRQHNLQGAHVIMLGATEANQKQAASALKAWPNALQVGGGINASNAQQWIDRGASKVIVTSWLFPEGILSRERLNELIQSVKDGKESIVIDLSCRRRQAIDGVEWVVAMNRWQTLTDTVISHNVLHELAKYCSEFLVHAADVEGLCSGIDEDLVKKLAEWSPIPVTYAGGARSLDDLKLVDALSSGKVDLTIGSALDIFGGSGVTLDECITWNNS
ncbi:putative 5-proFAR isomerase His6 [Ramicandelaber brevisporus]|nr:putative 5-proFAR isomerase His6 [Ramicandelaber brevisporus]